MDTLKLSFKVLVIVTFLLASFLLYSFQSLLTTRPARIDGKPLQGVKFLPKYSPSNFGSLLFPKNSNVKSLQCWASTLPGNVGVVEPFIHEESVLGFSLNPIDFNGQKSVENLVKLSDVIDLEEWNSFNFAHDTQPLFSWKYFIEYAPRNLILVDLSRSYQAENSVLEFYEPDNFDRYAHLFAQQ